jgi:hypothetical protein
MRITLTRFYSNCIQTLGELAVGNKKLLILEPKWENNDKQVSCIPLGIYTVVKRYSTKYKHHFHILDVPNRDFILIHIGNHHDDSIGCLIAGLGVKEINNDGELDVTQSGDAMKMLNDILPDKFEIEIVAHQLPSFIVK